MEKGMGRNSWPWWIVILLAAHVGSGHGGDSPPKMVCYLRSAGATFATECKFRITRLQSGWTITSWTDRGTTQMEVETRYDTHDQPLSANVVLTTDGMSETAMVLVKDGK